ncbi:hypothetical protein CL614_07260 [archaeon]|nr:hypothetical protein [archaeon]|tara:strand:+ start:5100 stop:6101 length:1002 start_codon:yes stop_codon:yes gene_type:complete
MKRAEFNFVWLFAIIAGGMILVLAVYGATRLGDTARFQSDTEIAKQISIITDPMQAGFAEGSFGKIIFHDETRINNWCFDGAGGDNRGSTTGGGFGRNSISVSSRSNVGEEWGLPGAEISIPNKYIFSNPSNSGKEYYVFSKPFKFPYKVADLIFLMSGEYCFIDAPDKINDEILGLGIPNIAIENCTSSDSEVKVCFGSGSASQCGSRDVVVYGACVSDCDRNLGVYTEGSIMKDDGRIEYVGGLMYGGIFSDKEIYNCNVKRLLYRTAKIAEIFGAKADLMNGRDCSTNLKPDLFLIEGMAMNSTSDDLLSLNVFVKQVEEKNKRELCGVW